MIVVVSGIRDLAPESAGVVAALSIMAATTATQMRFGGALGTDTVALRRQPGLDWRSARWGKRGSPSHEHGSPVKTLVVSRDVIAQTRVHVTHLRAPEITSSPTKSRPTRADDRSLLGRIPS